jgi:hypothetical protein
MNNERYKNRTTQVDYICVECGNMFSVDKNNLLTFIFEFLYDNINE